MFPNSPNIRLKLLTIESVVDSVGSKNLIIVNSKEVVGIKSSITSKEFYTAKDVSIKIDMCVKIQSFLFKDNLYALIGNDFYKIERTYLNGGFIELYLNRTEKGCEDFKWQKKS